jgi:hypothetical protein
VHIGISRSKDLFGVRFLLQPTQRYARSPLLPPKFIVN